MRRWATRGWAASAVVWMAVIFGLSSLPGSSVPGRYGSLGHLVVYAVLGALYYAALAGRLPVGRAALIAIALASAYGITDEFHQSFVPGRVPDPVDWLVDTTGAALAVAALVVIGRWRERTSGGAGS
ncbi:MAG: VanZ family protein [Coriobacteriia bacterium]|nr:VanZ family protein [Actinomycetota bacterium]MDZ4167146.1 VanZ family protein [Coriobacteriia bacterium]